MWSGNGVKVDTGGRQEFKTVYHSDGNKAISFLAAGCQFNEAWCWPSSFFIASLSQHFSMRDSLTLPVSIFLWLLPSISIGLCSLRLRHLIFFEWFLVISLQIQTPFFLPLYSPILQSRCTTHGENTGDAFPCATRDVHNPIPVKQMSYISLSLRKPR